MDFALYVPTSWTEDPSRRAAARIPEDLRFQTKIDQALGMIERAVQDGLPGEIVLADSAYGESNLSRETVRLHGLDHAVGVYAPTKVRCLDKSERRRGEAIPGPEPRKSTAASPLDASSPQ